MFKNKIFNSSYFFRFVLSANVLFVSSSVFSEDLMTDSVHRRKLREVVVNGQHLQSNRAAMPEQTRSEKEISLLNADNVADVAKYFSGVTVKDYGGIGGLKTVSLRGLGAQHTGVCYDGVMMSDIQSGQIDLGRFSIDNIAEITLNNAQPSDIFQTARMFSAAGVLSFKAKMPVATDGNKLQGKATIKTGSFGLYDAGIFLLKNINKNWAYNFSVDGQVANGKYTFTEYYGNKTNLSERLMRNNSDVQSIRSEANVLYRIGPKEELSLKGNVFLSERGLPGGVIWYNTYSKERLWDKVHFMQLHYENRRSSRVNYQTFARFNSAYNRYRDLNASYQDGILNEAFQQNEYYLSGSMLYRPVNQFQISASADWWYNDLLIKSTSPFSKFTYPTRHSGLANVAAKYLTDRFTVGTNVLYTLTREKVLIGEASPDRNRLSPTVSLSYKLLEDRELRLRAFYKNIFRVPTFNELYYQDLGNHNLRPEITDQYNVGLTYLETTIPFLSELSCSIDGYYNKVTDKIVAIPKDLFHWSMVNKDKVEIKGFDANIKVVAPCRKTDELTVRLNCSYQKATDVTPKGANYGEQIPYLPFYSGSASANYHHRFLEFGYNLQYSGKRWRGQNIPANRLDSYLTHSLVGTIFHRKWKFTGEVINLLDKQYEIVKFYPMPGRNFRVTLSKNF